MANTPAVDVPTGIADMAGGVALVVMSAYAFAVVLRGVGINSRPYGPAGVPDAKQLGVLYCLGQGIIHIMRGTQRMAPSSRGLYLPHYEYADFIFFCPMIVLDIMFTLKIPGKLFAAGVTALALFVAANAYAADAPYQWVLFCIGLCLLALLFERLQAGVRGRLAELPRSAVSALYVAMVAFFGMWPLFPMIFLIGPRGANLIGPLAFVIIHSVLDVVCKGVLALALLRVRSHMEGAGWYPYALSVSDIRERLIKRLGEDEQEAKGERGPGGSRRRSPKAARAAQ